MAGVKALWTIWGPAGSWVWVLGAYGFEAPCEKEYVELLPELMLLLNRDSLAPVWVENNPPVGLDVKVEADLKGLPDDPAVLV